MMRPETIARRTEDRAVRTAELRATLAARLAARAEEEGPGSIWAELLSEHAARHAIIPVTKGR